MELKDRNGAAPLIASQKFYSEAYRRTGINHMDTFALRLSGILEFDVLRRSFAELVRRQESLRTRFVTIDGELRHQVAEPCEFQLKLIDLSRDYSSEKTEEEARRYIEALAARGCDWATGKLFIVELLRLSEQHHILVVAIHHFVTDGISRLVTFRELWSLYAAFVRGRESPLKPVRAQFSDFLRWQREACSTWSRFHSQFWSEYLAGAQGIQWPNTPEPVKAELDGVKVLEFSLEESITEGLNECARQNGVSLSLAAFSIYIAAVSAVCDQRDFVVTTTLNGRDHADFEQVTGYIGHPFYWRMRLDGHEAMTDLLGEVAEEFNHALFRKDFGDIVLQNAELMGRTLVQWFPWPPDQIEGVPSPSQLSDLPFAVEPFSFTQPPNFPDSLDMAVVFGQNKGAIAVKIFYRPDVLAIEVVTRFIHALQSAAKDLVMAPAVLSGHLPTP